MLRWLTKKMIDWLAHEHPAGDVQLCNFKQLSEEIKPCDVVLVEGRSRVSNVIKNITQSSWTHSVLYVGRLDELSDEALRCHIEKFYHGDRNEPLIIEALLGHGTEVHPLSKYDHDHLRLCRPRGLSPADATAVLWCAAQHLGAAYDVRQMLDLARLLLPYGIVPRRWRSSLFEHNVGIPTRTVCSSMIAAAFACVCFPVLPVIQRDASGRLRLFHRNTKLYTPRDFDYSPYFDIIKYPILGLDDLGVYRQLPWDENGVVCNSERECYIPEPPKVKHSKPKKATEGKRRFAVIHGSRKS